MERTPTRTLSPLDLADPQRLEEALLHWDELDDASLVRLASQRATARRLAAVRRIERFLDEGGLAPRATASSPTPGEPCPGADELYDLGRGPGFVSLAADERAELEAHVARCADCAGLVATLASPPPLPLDLAPEPVSRRVPARPLRETRSWLPLAAAAGIAGALLLPQLLGPGETGLEGLPVHAQLRGAEDPPLLFPRGRVLAAAGAGAAPLFEVAGVAGAEGYRVEVLRYSGGAFEEGDRVQLLQDAGPTLTGSALPTGHYTWRAFATVDGLERELGAEEFEVVRDDVRAAWLAPAPEGPGLVERIAALHEAGYLTDARALARELPDGPQKDAYLRPPGR